MKIITAFHGTDYLIRSIDDIKIDERSLDQFYGAAFYVSFSKQRASRYGKYVFEIKFDSEKMYSAATVFDVRTLGTFGQFLDVVRDSSEEYLSDEDFYSDDADEHIEDYIEANYEKLLDEYVEEQGYIRDELENEFDGVIDDWQCAIYFPHKVIVELKLVEEQRFSKVTAS